MITVAPSASFEATALFATGLTGTLGVRILDNAGATTTARATVGIAEYPAGSGNYYVSLTAPSVAGDYSVFWDNGAVTPGNVATEDLRVTSTADSGAIPSGFDLTTLAAVRSYLQKPTADTGQDTIIQSEITRASRMILEYTQREFAPVTASATRRLLVYPGRTGRAVHVDLAPYDLRSVTSASLHPETASPTVLTAATEYLLAPENAPFGVYTAIRLARSLSFSSDTLTDFGHACLDITGAWGFASVPDDVVKACIVTVGLWMRREVQAFSTTFNLDEGRLERPEALPSAVRASLSRYRRLGASGFA